MVFTCKICKNRSNLAMFGFPSKPSALNNWRIAAKIPDDTKTSNFKLCFRHFDSNNIEAVIKIEYSLKNKGKNVWFTKFHSQIQRLDINRIVKSNLESSVFLCQYLSHWKPNLTYFNWFHHKLQEDTEFRKSGLALMPSISNKSDKVEKWKKFRGGTQILTLSKRFDKGWLVIDVLRSSKYPGTTHSKRPLGL